jgi:cell division septal protein FtsQ
MEKTTKQYRNKSRLFKALGITSTVLGTLGGFFIYQMAIDWQNFQSELENFVVVNQENIKLNMVISIAYFNLDYCFYVGITLRKNREFFKDKVSLSLVNDDCYFVSYL